MTASPTLAPAGLQQHPLSAAFPAMSEEEFQSLKDSIEISGVLNPVTIYEGQVIDGWHRYCAAQSLGMPCPVVELDEGVDPKDFVLAQNKARRHATAAQLAMAAAAVFDWRPLGANQHGGSALSADPPKSAREMADAAGVGTRTMEQAKAVHTNGVPEVKDAVKRGEIGLPKASKIAALPKDQQAQALARPKMAAQDIGLQESPAPQDEGPDAAELAANEAAEAADRLTFNALLDADDKFAAAVAEITRLNALNAQLQQRLHGLMGEKNEAIRLVKSLQRRLDLASKGGVA